MPKAAKVCNFCGEPVSGDSPYFEGSSGSQTARICDSCLWSAVAIAQETVEEATRDVYVATSKLHGRGLFAGERIAKGSFVGTYWGADDIPLTRHNQKYAMYVYDDVSSDEVRGWRVGTNEFRFLNHSDTPNLWMDDNWHFWALRSIKKDEELTWYYGDEFSGSLRRNKVSRKKKSRKRT